MSAILKALPIITVTTKGTAVPFSASQIDKVIEVYISAPAANTGNILVGDSTVEGNSGLAGVEVAKGTILKIGFCGEYIDLTSMYADALNNGDKVLVSYLVKA